MPMQPSIPGQFPTAMNLSAVNGATGFKLDGALHDYIGASVSTAGDVNNDGIADVIIGTYSSSPYPERAYVVFGQASGWTSPISLGALNGADGFELDGVDASDFYASTAGDVNNDGIDDIMIGAPGANSRAGKTYVIFGQATAWTSPISLGTLNGTNGFELDGVSAGEQSGYSVSTAGDVNNDGIDDIMIGAPGANSNTGKTYVVFGQATAWTSPISLSTLNGTNGFELDGVSPNDYSGKSVKAAGDVNHDGIADIIIGAPAPSPCCNIPSPGGQAYVVFGKASGWTSPISLGTLNGNNGFEIDGVLQDYSGWSVSAAGDVNHDGIDDIIIGTPIAFYNIYAVDKAYVVFGKTSGWTSRISASTLNGTNGFVLMGGSCSSVSAAGDVNNDGVADIVIGSSGSNTAYVVFGDSPPVLVSNTLTVGPGCTTTLDSAHLAAYDLNHDNSTLVFTASNVINGYFQKNVLGLITLLSPPVFLQSDITSGYVQFVSTNSNVPSYTVTVNSPGFAFVPATRVAVNFTSCVGSPTLAPSLAPPAPAVSSAFRTGPAWFFPISQAVSLLDGGLSTAYQSVSDYYLSGPDVSSNLVTHNSPYTSSSLETVGAQLMLGAVALKLVQKGINWVKGFWESKPALQPDAKPVLVEAEQSLQTPQGSEDMQHLTKRMGACKASLGENSAESAEIFYPDFQKPGMNFSYGSVARKNTLSATEQATFSNNSARLATRGR